MGYRVYYNFDDGTTEDVLDEVFPTKREAYLAALEGKSNYDAGREVLYLAGEDYSEENIIDWEIVKEN